MGLMCLGDCVTGITGFESESEGLLQKYHDRGVLSQAVNRVIFTDTRPNIGLRKTMKMVAWAVCVQILY